MCHVPTKAVGAAVLRQVSPCVAGGKVGGHVAALIKAGKASEAQTSQDKSLARLEDLLTTKEGAYEKPQLIDQLNYLRQQLDQADQAPGKDLYLRYEELRAQAAGVLADYAANVKK